MEFDVENNQKQLQLQISQDGAMAVLQYRYLDDKIWLMHTEVPKSMEGKGAGSALAHYAFEWAKSQDKKVKIICPFVAIYLKRHPEYEPVVDL